MHAGARPRLAGAVAVSAARLAAGTIWGCLAARNHRPRHVAAVARRRTGARQQPSAGGGCGCVVQGACTVLAWQSRRLWFAVLVC
jgi:hypothetical protein